MMKNLLCPLLLAVACCHSACVSKKVAEDARSQRDSLEVVVGEKDSLINAVFADINAISENLALIKSRENLITFSENSEGVRRPVEEIAGDIAAIDRLLQENRAKIAALQSTAARLRKANLRIEALETTIANLNSQLAEKSEEIASLRDELSQRTAEVAVLTEQVETTRQQAAESQTRADRLSTEKEDLEHQLNTVYYLVGSERELRDAQIINKEGVIGRTLTLNTSGSLDSFTRADKRLLEEIPVDRRRVTIVTPHPEGSYQLITDADKRVTKLVIDNPERFWEQSKILVVSYK